MLTVKYYHSIFRRAAEPCCGTHTCPVETVVSEEPFERSRRLHSGAAGPASSWTNPETGGPLPVGTAFPMSAGGMFFHEAPHHYGALLP